MFNQFPDTLNNNVARITAFLIFLTSLSILVSGQYYLTLFLALDFSLRTLLQPKYALLSFIAIKLNKILKLKPIIINGKPKRFAQMIGMILMILAFIFYLLDLTNIVIALTVILAFFSFLESVLSYCVGCKIFRILVNSNILSQDVCIECNNIDLRLKNNKQ